ncbi:Coronin-like protein crn1, partial [Coemansia erecta]
FADDKLHDLSVYSSAEPQRGLGVMPKRGVDVAHCEVMRFFKVASNSLVEPISFKVPRKSEAFQSDIYPPAPAGVPALSASEFFAGKDAEPLLVDMERLFREGPLVVGAAVKEKPEVMAEQKAKPETKTEAVSEPAPAPAPKHEPKPEITPEPEPVKAPSVPVQPPVTDSIPPSDAQLSALREENGRLQQQLMQATHDVAEAQAAAQSATAQLASSKQSLAQLQDELTKTQQNIDSLRTELSDASSMIESARAEAAKADAQVQDAATQVAEYRNKLAQAEDCVRGLEQDREKIQGELAQAIQAASSLALAAEKAADAL